MRNAQKKVMFVTILEFMGFVRLKYTSKLLFKS